MTEITIQCRLTAPEDIRQKTLANNDKEKYPPNQ